MRPYVAIMLDSFREAATSRVLWILLSIITSLMIVISTLGYRQKLTSGILKSDITDWNRMVATLERARTDASPSPASRIWHLLDTKTKETIVAIIKLSKEQPNITLTENGVVELHPAFAEVLTKREFYDEESWQGISKGTEIQDLLDQGIDNLTEEEVGRLNRVLLEAAFPHFVVRSPPSSIEFTFLHWPLFHPIPLRKNQIVSRVEFGLLFILRLALGYVGVMAAVLVTSPIIPQTFGPGSVSLLLSKPISRSLLFLTKFCGGCSFMLLAAAYLIVGLWFLAGWRFGVWMHTLPLCLPIFLFLFAIYYSVSALAGVIWKNAVVSVVMTFLLWLFCLVIGTAKWRVEQIFVRPNRIIHLIEAGDTIVGLNESQSIVRWDASELIWKPVLNDQTNSSLWGAFRPQPSVLGPIYDDARDQIMVIPHTFGTTGILGIKGRLWVGRRNNGWSKEAAATVPSEPLELLKEPNGGIIIVAGQGIFRLVDDPFSVEKPINLFGLDLESSSGPFALAGPDEPINLKGLPAIAMNSTTGALAVLNKHKLTLLSPDDDGNYMRRSEHELDDFEHEAIVAFGGSSLLLATFDGTIRIVDAATMETRHEFQPAGSNKPRFARASSDGRWFAVVYQHEQLVLIDAETGQTLQRGFTGQGSISAANFTADNRLLVADRSTRVTIYQTNELRRLKIMTPKMGWIEKLFYYSIVPLHRILPQPSELNGTALYLLSGKESVPSFRNESAHLNLRPWDPVWSGLGFLVVVLGLSCWYVERSEF